jgi:hypothetical protein
MRSRLALLNSSNRSSQSVAIRTILKPSRPVDKFPGDPLEAEVEKRPITDFEQTIGHVNSVVGVDPDQVSIEGRMMELR